MARTPVLPSGWPPLSPSGLSFSLLSRAPDGMQCPQGLPWGDTGPVETPQQRVPQGQPLGLAGSLQGQDLRVWPLTSGKVIWPGNSFPQDGCWHPYLAWEPKADCTGPSVLGQFWPCPQQVVAEGDISRPLLRAFSNHSLGNSEHWKWGKEHNRQKCWGKQTANTPAHQRTRDLWTSGYIISLGLLSFLQWFSRQHNKAVPLLCSPSFPSMQWLQGSPSKAGVAQEDSWTSLASHFLPTFSLFFLSPF